MNLQEINFEQAKLLKQAGFVEHTTKFFDKNGVLTGSLPVNHNLHKDRFSCVTVPLALKWIRENTDYLLSVRPSLLSGYTYQVWYIKLSGQYADCGGAETYEGAESAGLSEILGYKNLNLTP